MFCLFKTFEMLRRVSKVLVYENCTWVLISLWQSYTNIYTDKSTVIEYIYIVLVLQNAVRCIGVVCCFCFPRIFITVHTAILINSLNMKQQSIYII